MKEFILYKQILHNCKFQNKKGNCQENGFTLIEVISTLLMGSIILGAAFSGFFQIKEFFGKDKLTMEVNQRLRTAFETMGPDLQQLGEGIANKQFPAVTLSTNNNGRSEITIRRGGLQPLTLCGNITANTTTPVTVLDKSLTSSPACISVNDSPSDPTKKDGWPDVVKDWQNLRNGNTVKAYILDTVNNKGEFFEYKGEETLNSSGASMTPSPTTEPHVIRLTTNNHRWANSYPAGTTAIYLFDESNYKVTNNNTLQLIRNGEVFDLVEDIDKLDITAIVQKGVSSTPSRCKTIDLTGVSNCTPTFTGTYTWNFIESMEVKITALPPQDKKGLYDGLSSQEKEKLLSLRQQFLPRNRFNF